MDLNQSHPHQTKVRRLRLTKFIDISLFILFIVGLVVLLFYGATAGKYQWEWYRVPQYLIQNHDGEMSLGPLLLGLLVTLEITFWSFILMIFLGLGTALLSLSKSMVGRGIALFYVESIRNIPLLILLFIFYFALAPVLRIDGFTAGILCLATFEGAYAAEIFRSGFDAVPKGQWEAGQCVGLSKYKNFRYVILPQAIKLILPPMAGQSISLIKDSAIVSVIAVGELATEGRNIISDTLLTFEIWITVAGLYLIFTMSLSFFVSFLEKRMRTERH